MLQVQTLQSITHRTTEIYVNTDTSNEYRYNYEYKHDPLKQY